MAARAWLQEVIAEQPAGGTRAEALVWLVLAAHSQNRLVEVEPYLRQAIAEATDNHHIRAAAQRLLALYLVAANQPAAADPYAAAALGSAQASG